MEQIIYVIRISYYDINDKEILSGTGFAFTSLDSAKKDMKTRASIGGENFQYREINGYPYLDIKDKTGSTTEYVVETYLKID